MKRIYNKTVKELITDFTKEFQPPEKEDSLLLRSPLNEKGYFLRNEILSWFQSNYPQIKLGTINAHLILMSVNAPSRIHYNVHSNGQEDLLYQIDSNKFRLYDRESDPPPIYKETAENSLQEVTEEEENDSEPREFAYEKDLQNFLVKNLELIEPGLTLFEDEEINGIEFGVGGRRIDILAVDNNNDYVVIELKVSKGYDRVVGQLLRYMGWIQKNQADAGQKVRGIIICKKITEDLLLACSNQSDITLFEYDLSIKLRRIEV